MENFEGRETTVTEADYIFMIFFYADHSEQKLLYQTLEGHAWSGEFKNSDWITPNLLPHHIAALTAKLNETK
jgi:hypothetical protein